MDVLITNLSIARQVIYVEPADTIPSIDANMLWRATWSAIGEHLSAPGHANLYGASRKCVERSKQFSKLRKVPFVMEQSAHM